MRLHRKWPGPIRYEKRERPDTAGIKVVTSQFCERGKAFKINPYAFVNVRVELGWRKSMSMPEDNVTTVIVHPADYHDLMAQLPKQEWHVRLGAKPVAIHARIES